MTELAKKIKQLIMEAHLRRGWAQTAAEDVARDVEEAITPLLQAGENARSPAWLRKVSEETIREQSARIAALEAERDELIKQVTAWTEAALHSESKLAAAEQRWQELRAWIIHRATAEEFASQSRAALKMAIIHMDELHPPSGEPVEENPERDLTFGELRRANMARLPHFTNRNGDLAHSEADGSDWSPAQWLQAVVGELGEYANLRKKYERGDIGDLEFVVEASYELADVVTYLDILATQVGIDLGRSTVAKFNMVSERVGSTVTLPPYPTADLAPGSVTQTGE